MVCNRSYINMKPKFKILSLCFVACLLVVSVKSETISPVPWILLPPFGNLNSISIAGSESHDHHDRMIVCVRPLMSWEVSIGYGGTGGSIGGPIGGHDCWIDGGVPGRHVHDITENLTEVRKLELSCAMAQKRMYADVTISDNRRYLITRIRIGVTITMYTLIGRVRVDADTFNSTCRSVN